MTDTIYYQGHVVRVTHTPTKFDVYTISGLTNYLQLEYLVDCVFNSKL